MQLSDDQCLDLWIRQRDVGAFQELVSRHGGMVYGVALRLTKEPNISLEIAKTCFKKLIQLSLLPPVPIAVFLHREATREAMSVIKQLPPPSDTNTPVSWNDIRPRIDVLIANLSEKYSLPIILHILEGQESANLVTYLRLPREKIDERVAKGIEHIRRGLSLVKINLTVPQLSQILSTNAYEPCPAQLIDGVAGLIRESLSSDLPTTEIRRRSNKVLIRLTISLGFGVATILFLLILVMFLNKTRQDGTGTDDSNLVVTTQLSENSISNEGETKTQEPSPSPPPETKEPTKEGEPVETKAEIKIDLNRKIFQLLYNRYDEQRKKVEPQYYTSRSFTPMDAFYYYLLAVESLPPADINWLQQTWEILLTLGNNPVPEEIVGYVNNIQMAFQQWRDGISYERGILPPPVVLNEPPLAIEPFQNFFELLTINLLVLSHQPNDSLIMDVNLLVQFAESLQKQVYGKLTHIPLYAIESMGIVLRELARLRLLSAQQFRDGMNLLLRSEKIAQDKNTVKYNEYRQIAVWAQTEIPSVSILRQALQNILNEPSEKDWLARCSEQELQNAWETFLKLPPTDEGTETKVTDYPLEELRKIIFPPDTMVDQHRKHVNMTLTLSKIFLAVEWYAVDNGVYPVSLDYLVPSYLAELGLDKFSELSIQYEFDGNVYQIHSGDEGLSLFLPWHGNFEY
ncbi:MAG TPA: hypothetical protein PLT82_11145 [Candidatus Hydrogenedens sp.]|nr:hypothetical protein [Candidatus Hydrogenedens sp.]HOK10571.1 hypothetical protein [Candidatus Hydrogenedens sp.]HOL20968.1 hypothetical protein [Candidatus Hydrogenedens sp.]HPP59678.1 hypothetical protein [Candidatus Hydrogenedens sp.]